MCVQGNETGSRTRTAGELSARVARCADSRCDVTGRSRPWVGVQHAYQKLCDRQNNNSTQLFQPNLIIMNAWKTISK